MSGTSAPGFRTLVEVSPGKLVWTSEAFVTITTVVLAGPGSPDCLIIDPAVHVDDLAAFAAALAGRGLRPTIGWSTHPHWDHVLWATSLGPQVPRFGTSGNVTVCEQRRDQLLESVQDSSPGHELDLVARLQPIARAAADLPWSGPRTIVIEHLAHARGHGSLHLVDLGVLIAGDMCSDIEIPLLDLDQSDPVGDYRRALDAYSKLEDLALVIPGHGAPGDLAAFRERVAADRRYLDDLELGRPVADGRLSGWLVNEHERHVERLRTGSVEKVPR